MGFSKQWKQMFGFHPCEKRDARAYYVNHLIKHKLYKRTLFLFLAVGLCILNICQVSKTFFSNKEASQKSFHKQIKDPTSVCVTFQEKLRQIWDQFFSIFLWRLSCLGLGSVPVPYSMSKCFCEQSSLQQQSTVLSCTFTTVQTVLQ